ncbi:unnamed protein product [Effrenium voratum]|nr:unnamed protein product [Effrenium voratum]
MIRPGTSLTKQKQKQRAAPKVAPGKRAESARPTLEEFLTTCDYVGAITLLEFERKAREDRPRLLMWLAYSYFHNGDYKKALDAYDDAMRKENNPSIHVYKACCLYALCQYQEAEEEAKKAPDSSLKTRVLFQSAHKRNDESAMMIHHQALSDSKEDQLCLAAIQYLRSHFQEATDIYKRMLVEDRDDLALNVYIAFCYYKLDYYDVALEILQSYLTANPHSTVAVNLKACSHYQLYNGKAVEAYNLIKDLEPSMPREYILKGVVFAALGQATNSREHLKLAQQLFQLVGASASECDTIPGRQCMASCFFLLRQFEDVLVYLKSIKAYFSNDDDFNWNYGLACAAAGDYREAKDALLQIQNEKYRSEFCYLSWLTRCHIMSNEPARAWEAYVRMDTSNESFNLLHLIANDCYKMGQFYYACKAFDVLERLDPDPEFWEGKRGAAVGVFQRVVAGKESADKLREVVQLLRGSSNPQVETVTSVIKKWAKDNRVKVE